MAHRQPVRNLIAALQAFHDLSPEQAQQLKGAWDGLSDDDKAAVARGDAPPTHPFIDMLSKIFTDPNTMANVIKFITLIMSLIPK